ncbi:conserved phage C-terminal domain-containing protein [Enterobacter hormaechei subsp. hoffmannii]|uniref:conserved phage C-terminal domain-containing protein n=1 Tax=Enterobacter hormaechei TaxID=158836 RepID=UPI0007971D24|nr:conserved phage C-terminal domain-containing protein [Enterobacter hormaechei]MCU2913144.1 conserved phage C-terminal domain-containing protein [Enterobacter hormaechei subsp. hoffmannii]ELC6430656.1 conserved phage C-terminal domain-containing protein [Enterobacter hormaechei]MCM7549815.1 conserved phage C-terminal domain-containing protein [Enterobacter hormaechei]MCU2962383.1 conserved phage C-terminal domain-containing protein [Enterobacter hormaechei subsp. hoffmannii]MDX7007796.1 cons
MSLLMPSRPIVINPDLAYSIGLNEAIALQQVNYWLKETTSGLERDGVRWIYNTNEQWLEQFPFWSESTLKRTFTRLKNLGVLKVEQLNKSQRDMTNYYTINYESELLDEVKVTKSKSSKCTLPSGQNEPMEEVKVERSIGSKRTALIRSNCTDVLTENTTENTTDIKNPICPVAPQPDGDVLITDQAKQVLTHLNQVTSSRYQVSTTSLQNIRARIGEGFTVEELSLVVDYCNAKWSDDLTMAAYLRPQTLFQPTKFPGYLKSANSWANAGRPARVNGKWEREDGIFKSSFQNTDYSKVPAGFRGAKP